MSKGREYISNDYSAYNDAVKNELYHHRQIAEVVRQESTLRRAKVAVFVVAGISIALVSFALIYLIVSHTRQPLHDYVQPTQSIQESRDLGTISRNVGSGSVGITKAFNVFESTPMSTGELVVTSKNYEPSNLATPEYQYCYITSSASITNVQQIELADIDSETGELVIKTTDPFLIESALPLCSFVAP